MTLGQTMASMFYDDALAPQLGAHNVQDAIDALKQGTPGSQVGPSNAVFVDIAGSDANGERGNAARPFLTLTAALAAAHSGDSIVIGPGTFSSGASAVAIPATLVNIELIGYGELQGGTILTANVDTDALTLNAAQRSMIIRSLRIQVTGTGRGIVGIGGAGAAGAFMNAGLKLENVNITTGGAATDALNLTEAAEVVLFDVQASAASCTFVTCSNIRLRGETTLGAVQHTWDNTDANKPAAQSVGLELRAGTQIGAYTGTGQPLVNAYRGSVIASMTGNTLSFSTIGPSFTVAGQVGAIDFQSALGKRLPDPGGANLLTLNFSGAILTGNVSMAVSGANNQNVYFTGASGRNITFLADSRALMDMRGANYNTPTYTTSNTLATATGSILPPFLAGSVANGGATTAIGFGFTVTSTTYVITLSNSVATATPINWASKAVTGFDVTLGGTPGAAVIDYRVDFP